MKTIVKRLANKQFDKVSSIISCDISSLVSNICSVIEMESTRLAASRLNDIIKKFNPEKYKKYAAPRMRGEKECLRSNISYYIRIGKTDIIRISTPVEELAEHRRETKIRLEIFGVNHNKIRRSILKRIIRDDNHIETQTITKSFNFLGEVKTRGFDSIVMDETKKNSIIDGLRVWVEDEKWYNSHNIIHKKGILLYGKPGTGKSSAIRAISNMFDNAPIVTIAVRDIETQVFDLLSYRERCDGTIIVLIEDIDMVCFSRDSVSSDDKYLKCMNDQQTLFQLIDGIYSTENTIYIATTNYISELDEALIRPGRFDIQVELDYFDEELALQYVKKFGYDETTLSSFNIEYPIQPALLQSMVMGYRTNERRTSYEKYEKMGFNDDQMKEI